MVKGERRSYSKPNGGHLTRYTKTYIFYTCRFFSIERQEFWVRMTFTLLQVQKNELCPSGGDLEPLNSRTMQRIYCVYIIKIKKYS